MNGVLTTVSYPDGEEERRPWRVQLDDDCREWFGIGLVTFLRKWNTMEISFAIPCVITIEEPNPLGHGFEPLRRKVELSHERVVEMRMRIPDQWFSI